MFAKLLLTIAVCCPATPTDEDGLLTHDVTSPFAAGKTQIRVLLPDEIDTDRRYRVVYVLPVETRNEHRYGNGLREIKKHDLQNKHDVIFVAPTFSQLPWYADHPTDPAIRQESHFLKVVVPFVEENYPALCTRDGRLLLGFSKSGWGAWTLLLRHPDVFGRAAAWDAPLAMERSGHYGSGPIFGTQQNFERYKIVDLLRGRADRLRDDPRLMLLGYGSFREDHQRVHALLEMLEIPHDYRDGPPRKHDWHSGWVTEAVELLLNEPARR